MACGVLHTFGHEYYSPYKLKNMPKTFVRIPKDEYIKLRELKERFGAFWNYLEHLYDIREARKEVREKKYIAQEKLFKELGL